MMGVDESFPIYPIFSPNWVDYFSGFREKKLETHQNLINFPPQPNKQSPNVHPIFSLPLFHLQIIPTKHTHSLIAQAHYYRLNI